MAYDSSTKKLYTTATQGISTSEVAACLGDYRVTARGRDIGSIEDFVSRLTEVEAKVNALGSGTKNVTIQVASIITRSSLSSSGMNTLGLTLQVAEQMTQGAYNKVIDSSGTYPATWEYSAEKSSTSTVTVYLRKGADTYKLAYNGSGTWNISKI